MLSEFGSIYRRAVKHLTSKRINNFINVIALVNVFVIFIVTVIVIDIVIDTYIVKMILV